MAVRQVAMSQLSVAAKLRAVGTKVRNTRDGNRYGTVLGLVSLSLSLYIYIYIYRERERESLGEVEKRSCTRKL